MSTVQDPAPAAAEATHEGTAEPTPAEVWRAVRERARAATAPTDVWALRLVLLHLLPVAALVLVGGLYVDDLRAQVYASGRSLWPFVIESNATHLAPSARAVDWLQATLLPLQHGPAVVVTLAVHAALGLTFWWVLRELRSARVAALPFLVLALLQPGMLPATAWYRQTLTTLTGLVLTLTATALALRAERTGRAWLPGLLATLAVGVGAGFSERTLAAIPLSITLVVLRRVLQRSASATAARPEWRQVRWGALLPTLGGTAVVSAVFALAYRSEEYAHGGGPTTDWLNYPRLVWRSLTRDIVPAVLGGPWHWRPVAPSYALADPPTSLVVLANVALATVVAVALLRRRSRRPTLAALVALAAYALPVWFLLFYGRFPAGSLAGADDLRLWPDIGTILLLVAAAVVGRRPSSDSPGLPTSALAVLALVTALVTAGGVVSWSGFAERWSANQASGYLATLRLSLEQRPGVVLPSAVPADVVPGWVQADLTTTDLVGLLDPSRLSTVVDSTPLAVAPSGQVRPAVVTTRGRATAPAGSGFCGFSRPGTATDWLRVPFDQPVPYFRAAMLRVPVLVNDTVTIRGRVLDRDGRTVDLGPLARDLPGGPHVLMVLLPYDTAVAALDVRVDSPAPLCVPSAEVVTVEASR